LVVASVVLALLGCAHLRWPSPAFELAVARVPATTKAATAEATVESSTRKKKEKTQASVEPDSETETEALAKATPVSLDAAQPTEEARKRTKAATRAKAQASGVSAEAEAKAGALAKAEPESADLAQPKVRATRKKKAATEANAQDFGVSAEVEAEAEAEPLGKVEPESKAEREANIAAKAPSSGGTSGAWDLFVPERFAALKGKLKQKVTVQVANRIMSAEWAALVPEEKRRFEDEAQKLKLAYLAAHPETKRPKTKYTAFHLFLRASESLRQNAKKIKEAWRGLSAEEKQRYQELADEENRVSQPPKRPVNSFFLYKKVRRPEMTKEHPDWANTKVVAMMSEEWRNMRPEDKQVYQEAWEKAQEEYEHKLAAFDHKQSMLC